MFVKRYGHIGGSHSKSEHHTKRKIEQMKHNELEHLLDAEVSFYIRMTYADDDGSYAACYTCRTFHPVKELDAGHYISRVNRGTRWDLRNIRPQCTSCNYYKEGRKEVFRARLVEDIGEAAVKQLEDLAAFYGDTRRPREWLLEEIKRYRDINAKIRKRIRGLM